MLLAANRILHDTADPDAWHSHDSGQLSLLRHGVLSIATDGGRFWLPPGHLVWIPPGVRHASHRHGLIDGISLRFAATVCVRLPACAQAIACDALPPAIMRRALDFAVPPLPREQRLLEVLLDELEQCPPLSLSLPLPQDRRARRVADALTEAPDDPRSRDDWAQWAGLSGRSLSRLFPEQTGLSFQAWRRRLRLLKSLEYLSAGQKVGVAAWRCGYDSPSAFIAAFRQAFGQTPTQLLGGYADAFSDNNGS
ncbi:AraC family transcriptional regulator [Chromobacterium haemolyticum]|uniref:AraC family transcriptional regulator n=1 Tax=Chromobacterium fluminis TaxID=3044269 RepID=A0ABX0LEE6_9NEIS|nr:helix-turn-helix transcriptional regulator [Chromobacterium haemolyticum]NHR07887.1 AraC family transcriptional regulator [Chromobacterium haemolyticum]